jgi:hypothetical protein
VVLIASLAAVAGAYLTGRLPAPVLLAGQPAAAARPAGVPPAARPAPSPTGGDLAAAQAIVAAARPPARLQVPAIGVDARVEPVGQDAQGRMANPSGADSVAWFQPGVTPGDVGDAVLAGHLDWTSGPAVFWRLGSLRRGDEVTVVRADGSRARFVVDATSTMPFDAATDALFTRDGPPALTLITCAGAWDRQRGTYLQRLVVHTALAS